MAVPAATSIIDYLRTKGVQQQPGESIPYFNYRKNQYTSLGLDKVLGEFRGKPEQNQALLNKLQTPSPMTQPTAPEPQVTTPSSPTNYDEYRAKPASGGNFSPEATKFLTGNDPSKAYIQGTGSPDIFEKATGRRLTPEEAAKIPGIFTDQSGVLGNAVEIAQEIRPEVSQESQYKDYSQQDIGQQQNAGLINATTPSNISSLTDLANQDNTSQLTSDLTATLARAADRIPKQVQGMRDAASAKEALAVARGQAKASSLAEKNAGYGGAMSNLTKKGQESINQDAAMEAQVIEAKFGQDLYSKLTAEEKQFGTEFLRNLDIKEAAEFVKLPVAVRGAVISAYEKAFTTAKEKANKEAQNTLNRLGYQMLPDGTLAPTLSQQRFVESQTQHDIVNKRTAEENAKPKTGVLTVNGKKYEYTQDEKTGEIKMGKLLGNSTAPKSTSSTTKPVKLSNAQILKGAANAKMTVAAFQKLPLDEQNKWAQQTASTTIVNPFAKK